MTEFAYDGNAALKMAAPEAPPQGTQERKKSAEAGPAPGPSQGSGPTVTKPDPEPKPKGARKLDENFIAMLAGGMAAVCGGRKPNELFI